MRRRLDPPHAERHERLGLFVFDVPAGATYRVVLGDVTRAFDLTVYRLNTKNELRLRRVGHGVLEGTTRTLSRRTRGGSYYARVSGNRKASGAGYVLHVAR